MDQANGIPEKPLTAFTIFVKDYNKKNPGKPDLFKMAGQAWANLDDSKREKYTQMQNKVSNNFDYIWGFIILNNYVLFVELRKLPYIG